MNMTTREAVRAGIIAGSVGGKYGNTRTSGPDGFDSNAEESRYSELLSLEKLNLARNIRRQVSYDLVVNGTLICRYVADFVYEELRYTGIAGVKTNAVVEWVRCVEDVKSKATKTALYRLKKKLMMACHGIVIQEVIK